MPVQSFQLMMTGENVLTPNEVKQLKYSMWRGRKNLEYRKKISICNALE
jgi:hypothetical protein